MCTVFQADSSCLSLADEKHFMSQLRLPHTVNLANEKLALMFFFFFFLSLPLFSSFVVFSNTNCVLQEFRKAPSVPSVKMTGP